MSKVIVITGAGEGLGRALARRFAKDGHTLVLLGRTPSKLEPVAKEIGHGAFAVKCDVGSVDSVKAAFAEIAKRHAKVDVLINNAGVYEPFLITEATDDQILTAIGTNLTGPILCTRAVVPMMEKGGHIINISSESVEFLFPYLWLYQSTKAGLERFSKAMYHELEPKGIRVTTVRAGQMFDSEKKMSFANPEVWQRFHAAALTAGLDLRKRPISQMATSTEVIYAIVNLPADVHIELVSQHAWQPN